MLLLSSLFQYFSLALLYWLGFLTQLLKWSSAFGKIAAVEVAKVLTEVPLSGQPTITAETIFFPFQSPGNTTALSTKIIEKQYRVHSLLFRISFMAR